MPCDSALLRVVGSGAASFLWSTGAKLDSIKVQPFQSTTYTVTVTDPEGCNTTVLSALVRILPPPPQRASIVGHNNDCDSITSYHLSQGNPQHTYVWTIPNSYGIFTATNTNTDTIYGTTPVQVQWTSVPGLPSFAMITLQEYFCDELIGTDSLKVFICCIRPDMDDTLLNDTLRIAYVQSDWSIFIQGNLVVDSVVLAILDSPGANNNLFLGPESSISLVNGASLLLENTYIQAGCDHMWSGIFSSDVNGGIIIKNSMIKDGITAINVNASKPMMIDTTEFIDNYKSIVYSDAHIEVASDYWQYAVHQSPYFFSVNGCVFQQSGFPSSKLLMNPYAGLHAYCAIEVINSDTVTIGNHNLGQNIFRTLARGIVATNSIVHIFNNVFDTIGSSRSVYPPNAAVWTMKDLTYNEPASTRVGGIDQNLANSFSECSYGIEIQTLPSNLTGNQFNNCPNGIRITNALHPTYVDQNILNHQQSTKLGRTAIQIQNVNPNLRLADVMVINNHISAYEKGIWLTNIQDLGSREVTIAADTILMLGSSTNAMSGIKLENCDGAYVVDNVIASPSVPSSVSIGKHNGIWVSQTGAARIMSNKILRTGHGIYTTGSLLLTDFICNDLDSCYHGFYFGDSTALSDQGIYDVKNPHNRYMGDYSSGSYPYYRRMGGLDMNIINAPIEWYYHTQYSVFDPGIISTYTVHPLFYVINDIENNNAESQCSFDTTVYDPFSIISPGEREAFLGEIADRQITYTLAQPAFTSFEHDLYNEIISSNSSILMLNDTSDERYQNLYDSLQATEPGDRTAILLLIEDGSYEQARSSNAILSAETPWAISRKSVNAIYLDAWAKGRYNFTSSEIDTLLAIATSSPYLKGDAVYTARILLRMDPDEHHLIYRSPLPEVLRPEMKISVYPNPADKSLFLKFFNIPEGICEAMSVTIFDVTGRVLQSSSVEIQGDAEYQLDIKDLKPGIHIVQVTSRSLLCESFKIIVN
jgi:hypothetical protein